MSAEVFRVSFRLPYNMSRRGFSLQNQLPTRAQASTSDQANIHVESKNLTVSCLYDYMFIQLFGVQHTDSHMASQDLNDQKNELVNKVQNLKKELQDWRSKLDSQVKSYRVVRISTIAPTAIVTQHGQMVNRAMPA